MNYQIFLKKYQIRLKVCNMGFRFKDKYSEDMFRKKTNDNYEKENVFNQEDLEEFYNEFIGDEEEIIEEKPIESSVEVNNLNNQDLQQIKTIVNRIEAKQNSVLKILKDIPLYRDNQNQKKSIEKNDFELLNINLSSFNEKLIILNTDAEDKEIEDILISLNQISDYISSNSFYVFTIRKSLIQDVLNSFDYFEMDKKISKKLITTKEILNKIDDFSEMDIFNKNYYYSEFLLQKGLLFQSIILLNETISIYIIESVKGFSKELEKYILIYGEEYNHKLFSQVKDFFLSLYPVNSEKNNQNLIPFFPNHKFIKDIDEKIIYKFNNLNTTWKNKGDNRLFEKYSYIIEKVRKIRNNLAHGNMEFDFKGLKKEIFEIMVDFKYLTITKNIFKYKRR